ncbi:hypothetical protein [Saccharopolyspora sp. NPDC002686]|uniref:hypothetical protein n=1 Tax=Saccharopolyspora sp. NPDC002686 TaxID=3154541 RepID=UPI00331957EC
MAGFESLYRHGFARVAAGVPVVGGADPELNADRTIELARRAAADHAVLALFPAQSSQFKRSALPNGPKIGSGGALPPRGDWRAPSDATARAWLDELDRDVPG